MQLRKLGYTADLVVNGQDIHVVSAKDPSGLPWAVVFPRGGALPRHPSELYEAVLEGPLLWLVVWGASAATHGEQLSQRCLAKHSLVDGFCITTGTVIKRFELTCAKRLPASSKTTLRKSLGPKKWTPSPRWVFSA